LGAVERFRELRDASNIAGNEMLGAVLHFMVGMALYVWMYAMELELIF
jgi:hypothetical protein